MKKLFGDVEELFGDVGQFVAGIVNNKPAVHLHVIILLCRISMRFRKRYFKTGANVHNE
jgi:hypothetical protein